MTNGPNRPNILWICTDQQRFDTIGALGNPYIHTPNIDRLVRSGVAFRNAFCQCPICTPSRASFLTGRYPSSVHGCMNGNDHWDEASPLVTTLLADDGYDCGLAGKFHLAGAQGRIEPRPTDDGYRVFHWSHSPRDDWTQGHAYADWVASQGEVLAELNQHPEHIPPALHQTTWCADKAIEFIEEDREGPWLMSVNVFDPHAPFDPPQEYLDRYNPASLPGPWFRESDLSAQAKLAGIDFQTTARDPESFSVKEIHHAHINLPSSSRLPDPESSNIREIQAAYYAMIELIDHNVGRMLDTLERTGQLKNTIVIFASDHGETLGDHGLLLKGCRFYEGLVRVPLIFSWPGHFRSGLISDALVELTDITPTLLEICGLGVDDRLQGRSLLSLLSGTSNPKHHRDFVRAEYFRTLNPDTPGRDDFEGTYATMIRDNRYKLITYHGHQIGELFDLQSDPWEFNNLWDDANYADVRFDLLKKSFDALAFAVDVGPRQVAYY